MSIKKYLDEIGSGFINLTMYVDYMKIKHKTNTYDVWIQIKELINIAHRSVISGDPQKLNNVYMIDIPNILSKINYLSREDSIYPTDFHQNKVNAMQTLKHISQNLTSIIGFYEKSNNDEISKLREEVNMLRRIIEKHQIILEAFSVPKPSAPSEYLLSPNK